MEIIRLVAPGGGLWKAWVAAHWERRLKRHDYQTADIIGMVALVVERLRDFSLRYHGHLLLGLCRLLLRRAMRLEEDADAVRSALLTSMATSGLPTVAAVPESAVTLKRKVFECMDPQILPDLGDPSGLDMLLEPELPALEMKAFLEEGRRYTAPLELITQRPEAAAQRPSALELGEGPLDAFGAPSQEDHLAMDLVEAAGSPRRSLHGLHPEMPAFAEVPPIDFLHGASPGGGGAGLGSGGAGSGFGERPSSGEPGGPGGLGSDGRDSVRRALQFDGLSGAGSADGLRPAPGSYLARLLELSPLQAAAEQAPHPAGAEPEDPAEDPAAAGGESALALLEDLQPMKRRRRTRPWLDEETQIPTEVYHDTTAITRSPLYECRLPLPHRAPHLGITTTLSDLCPLLCEPLLRAPAVGLKRRRALADATRFFPAPASPPDGGGMATDLEPGDAGGGFATDMEPGDAGMASYGQGAASPRSPPAGMLRSPLGNARADGGGEFRESPERGRRAEPEALEPEDVQMDAAPLVASEAILDQAAMAKVQVVELQHALGGSADSCAALSFFDLCERPPGGAEAGAQRFMGLLALHMEGAVSLDQQQPYADIFIRRGPDWPIEWMGEADAAGVFQ